MVPPGRLFQYGQSARIASGGFGLDTNWQRLAARAPLAGGPVGLPNTRWLPTPYPEREPLSQTPPQVLQEGVGGESESEIEKEREREREREI